MTNLTRVVRQLKVENLSELSEFSVSPSHSFCGCMTFWRGTAILMWGSMSDKSKVHGPTRLGTRFVAARKSSLGCKHCYAEVFAERFANAYYYARFSNSSKTCIGRRPDNVG
jgi:hypothetical protein